MFHPRSISIVVSSKLQGERPSTCSHWAPVSCCRGLNPHIDTGCLYGPECVRLVSDWDGFCSWVRGSGYMLHFFLHIFRFDVATTAPDVLRSDPLPHWGRCCSAARFRRSKRRKKSAYQSVNLGNTANIRNQIANRFSVGAFAGDTARSGEVIWKQ